ncbi:MAG TPA: DUF2490 domain-containing protein [Microscillaceae bacterium]|nr:DUF2490 domain-containing protein [Microscillaceae bacterium]
MRAYTQIEITLVFACLLFFTTTTQGQQADTPEKLKFKTPLSRLWINTYGNIRLSDKWFWIAQTHFRFQENNTTKFAGQVAQLYNRHAISYFFSKKFRASLGGVLRLNFNTDEVPAEEQAMVPEWRIWHQYLFAVPLSRLMVYHRIRIEHRWTRGFNKNSSFIFRNRWRYMLNVKIPINKPKLAPGAFYIAPEAELIMQSGKPIIESPMEDLRLHTSFGYILKPQLTVAAGLMYSTGQEITDGALYNQKWTLRFHVYFSPDFRKLENRLPAVN